MDRPMAKSTKYWKPGAAWTTPAKPMTPPVRSRAEVQEDHIPVVKVLRTSCFLPAPKNTLGLSATEAMMAMHREVRMLSVALMTFFSRIMTTTTISSGMMEDQKGGRSFSSSSASASEPEIT